jgi:carbonic anhydrase
MSRLLDLHMSADLVEEEIRRLEDFALRRVKGIPNNRRLFVLTCMDERIDVERALGIHLGDAHVFRNAGGIVTDDVIRSLSLTTNFFGTKEVLVITHTDCGMLRFTGREVSSYFEGKGVKLGEVELDPLLPNLKLQGDFDRWWKFFVDLGASSPDDVAVKGAEVLRNHPLIPKGVRVKAYVYEVETQRLRRPHQRIYEETSKFQHGRVVEG